MRFWLWIALAAFGVVISVTTLVITHGAAMAVWWGPVVFGVYKAIKTRPELEEIARTIALTPCGVRRSRPRVTRRRVRPIPAASRTWRVVGFTR